MAPSPATEHEALHEYIAFEDPDEYRTWVFDLTFLTSSWTCIYGCGCQGVDEEPAPAAEIGCCRFGAHFIDEDDHRDTLRRIEALTPEQWQFHAKGTKDGATKTTADGTQVTRVHRGACILLNRPGFAGGAGCALHQAAQAAGARPLDWKPDVCWQLPLRLDEHTDDHGHVTSTLREWKRRDWGGGGDDFAWWCTDAPDAFVGGVPTWEALADEIVEMVGQRVYDLLAVHLRERAAWQSVPHPALRRR